MFKGSLKGVAMNYQGCLKQTSRIGSFKGVSRKFQGGSRKSEGCFDGVLSMFQGLFKEVLL